MKNPSQAARCRTIGGAAAAMALAATLAVAPSIAGAQCAGDCDGSGTVLVSEVITLVNIALETAQASTCPQGIPSGAEVQVPLLVTAVNNALTGGCAAAVCGDGVSQAGEECDNGGICIGNDAGTVCMADADCCPNGNCTGVDGVCDTFGTRGTAGTVPRKVCQQDSECGGAKCIHCKTFGGDGCAANCTSETLMTTNLVPGQLDGTTPVEGTTIALVNGDPLNVPLPLNGTNALYVGKPGPTNLVPTVQKAAGVCEGGTNPGTVCFNNSYCTGGGQCGGGVNLDRIPVQSLACACVRGVVFKTCGGTQYEADGQTVSIACTNDPSLCTDPKKPCTAVAGPGNAGEGVIGCAGLPSTSYTIVQDGGAGEDTPGPAIFTPGGGGPAGSQVLATASQIGNVVGFCSGTDPTAQGDFYGPDGEFCTPDDPDNETVRGMPSIVTLVTGTATATLLNRNNEADFTIGPFSATGNVLTCDKLEAGMTAGAAQAGAFTQADNPGLGDIVVTNVFVSQ